MKQFENTLISAFAGTSMMTAFSYAVSMAEDENFSEPEHLGTLLHRLLPLQTSKQGSDVAGWVAHYGVGVFFVYIYQDLWNKRLIRRNLKNAIILGAISGAVGALIWEKTLRNHPAPPQINLTKYILQLVPAHIVFAVCATITSQLLKSKMGQK